jgi:hypothetical protein
MASQEGLGSSLSSYEYTKYYWLWINFNLNDCDTLKLMLWHTSELRHAGWRTCIIQSDSLACLNAIFFCFTTPGIWLLLAFILTNVRDFLQFLQIDAGIIVLPMKRPEDSATTSYQFITHNSSNSTLPPRRARPKRNKQTFWNKGALCNTERSGSERKHNENRKFTHIALWIVDERDRLRAFRASPGLNGSACLRSFVWTKLH